jgi:hypothetical protein
MIQNKLFTLSILTAVASAACFFGCSSDTTGSGAPGSSSGGPISASSSGGPGNSSSSGSSSSSGGVSSSVGDAGACMPPSSVPSSSLPPYVPVMAMMGACNSMQISEFLSNCVVQGAKEANCGMWANANSACSSCIVQGTDAGVAQTGAIIFSATGAPVSGNVPGCIALEDAMGGPACAAQLEPLMQCVAIACGNCKDQTSFSNCEKAARASGGACGSLSSAAESPCSTYLDGNGVGVSKCGYGTSNELEDVINVICGQGP